MHTIKNGLYGIHFQNAGVDFGSGVVSLRDGVLCGGDMGFSYQGRLEVVAGDEERVSVALCLQVKKWNPSIPSVIPGVNAYRLVVRGDYHPATATLALQGYPDAVPGVCLQIVAHHIDELAD